MSSSIRRQTKEEKIPPEKMQVIRQMFVEIMKNLDAMAERMDQRLERMEQRLTNIQRSNRCSERECSVETQELPKKSQALVIEPPMEPPTLLLAEPITKPAPQPSMEPATPQLSEPTPLPPPPPASEPSIPKMARVTKEHCFGVHTRHPVVERIGFRSYRSPLASCSAFVHLGHLHPAATPPFSSWTLNVAACIGQWELSDHG